VDALTAIHAVIAIVLNPTSAWHPQLLEFPSNKGGTHRYRLVARIDHSGVAPTAENGYNSHGHYTATVLRDKWYLADDSHIAPGNPEPAQNTYMAFYHIY
jgi:ubiquitin C-terminal hydrolase